MYDYQGQGQTYGWSCNLTRTGAAKPQDPMSFAMTQPKDTLISLFPGAFDPLDDWSEFCGLSCGDDGVHCAPDVKGGAAACARLCVQKHRCRAFEYLDAAAGGGCVWYEYTVERGMGDACHAGKITYMMEQGHAFAMKVACAVGMEGRCGALGIGPMGV